MRCQAGRLWADIKLTHYPAGPPPRYPERGGYAEGFRYGQAASAYQAQVDQAQEQQAKAANLYEMCLRARGWTFAPVAATSLPGPAARPAAPFVCDPSWPEQLCAFFQEEARRRQR